MIFHHLFSKDRKQVLYAVKLGNFYSGRNNKKQSISNRVQAASSDGEECSEGKE